ncbi:MAG: riboflavin kinase [Candidatus Gracilibacteria bacterium]|nr:riboflavin kinase [Candidatus Gracilibacteria bacterium]
MSKEILIEGEVVSGKKLGRNLGFPTVNIVYKGDFEGVFVGEIILERKQMPAAVFIGKGLLEVYILDWSGEICEREKISVKLLKKIRDIKKFENYEDLKSEISKDVEFVKNWYNRMGNN